MTNTNTYSLYKCQNVSDLWSLVHESPLRVLLISDRYMSSATGVNKEIIYLILPSSTIPTSLV